MGGISENISRRAPPVSSLEVRLYIQLYLHPILTSIVYTAASKSNPAPNTSELDSQEAHTKPAANGQPTPQQASRHLSASGAGTAPITITTSSDSPPVSPKQPLRVSSSPLPTRNSTGLDLQHPAKNSLGSHLNGQDSPVMNETLSVIDEHITDLSTPRHSLAPPDLNAASAANNHHNHNNHNNDSGSEYSAPLGRRFSYINGHETDEEEESRPTEDQVRKWGHQETAKHLRDIGVDEKHCDIFEEQEITGDVLLDMDQDFLFMKEFDFGVMGRRLKTWHKVKAFQEDVKGSSMSSSSSSPYPAAAAAAAAAPPPPLPEERSASRATGQTGTFLPRIPTFTEKSSGSGSSGYVGQSRASTSSAHQQHSRLSSIQSNSSYGMDRPSAASVRGINHSRRHSSIDTTNRSFDLGSDSPHPSSFHHHHSNKPSLDRSWSMAASGRRPPTRPGTSLGTSTTVLGGSDAQRPTPSVDANECDSAISVTDRYDDLDRGYFSGPEGDVKKNRRVLTKRSSEKGSVTHSRQSSYNDDPRRHSRIASIDSIRDAARATKPTPSFGKNRLRSLSTRLGSSDDKADPAEDKSGAAPSMGTGLFSFSKSGDSSTRSSTIPFKNAGPKIRRAVGLDNNNNNNNSSSNNNSGNNSKGDSPTRENEPHLARTGSATPSAASKSSSRRSADRQSTGSGKADVSFPRTRPSIRGSSSNVKSKQETSAYIQGLEKKAPKEQMELCDYSGWMKKRSSNLMTTWKPRLFVLRGRRLSYYYSETDNEERGLIDITGHRVLRADNDPIVTLHATITGSTTSPTSPANGSSPSTEKTSSESTRGLKGENSGPFFFKLVPPKAGVARSVQFTKPAIHYFQVDTIREGRLWMAALMKATIERDLEQPIESTNKQKTISLKQARLTNQRPPALSTPDPQEEDEDEAEAEAETPDDSRDSSGLGLGAFGLDKPDPADYPDTPNTPEDKKHEPVKPLGSNPLGGIDTGPSLLQEPVADSP